MPETAPATPDLPKLPRASIAKNPVPKLGPKRFDPGEHGGVKKQGALFFIFGVLLPLIAIVFECNVHFCARHFFDPFPSAGHVVLFALIPLSNYLVWLGTRRDLSNHYAFMSLVSGMAMGVACLYSLMFLPLTPLACLFTLALGFGFLALAPLLSLPCNWIAGKTVCHLAARKITYFNAHQVEHLGHMIILVMVIAIELPSTMTRINLSRAVDLNPAIGQSALVWLRKFGSQEVLLRACYERSGRATDILGSLYESAHPLNVDEARRVFYQVTGKPFNAVPIPRSARATIQHSGALVDPLGANAGVEDEFDLDTDVGGEVVSGVARGLSISQSKFSGILDPDSALASLDWTFSFTNDSEIDREARAKLLLPPGAVVTRATLTVDNVEREASIMVRQAARARYRMALAQRKDPLLVSTCGQDQILVQCFPVKAGQTMTIKLRLAAPLVINEHEKACLVFPAFLERNFQLEKPSIVDLDCTRPLAAKGLTLAVSKSESNVTAPAGPLAENKQDYNLTGSLSGEQLASFSSIVQAERDRDVKFVSCTTQTTDGGPYIARSLQRPSYGSITSLSVIIDGSAAMQQFMPQIEEGLKALPPTISCQVQIVGDNVVDVCSGIKQGASSDYISSLQQVKNFKAAGGEDDFTTLNTSLTQLASSPNAAVLWIHAAQPISSGNSFAIKSNLERFGQRPGLFDMQLLAGPTEILNGLSGFAGLVRVPRSDTVAADLRSLLLSLDQKTAVTSELCFCPAPPDADSLPTARVVDSRLAQIWAGQEIARQMQEVAPGGPEKATLLASSYQIVSAASSAVVVSELTPPVVITAAPAVERSTNAFGFLSSIFTVHKETKLSNEHDLLGRPIEHLIIPSPQLQNAAKSVSASEAQNLGGVANKLDQEFAAQNVIMDGPPAKVVPEADSIWLLIVIGMVLFAAWIGGRRRVTEG